MDIECPNCLANYSTLKKKQEDVEILYAALLNLLSRPNEREQALNAVHFIEAEGE